MVQSRYHNRDISGWTLQSSVNVYTYDSIITSKTNVEPHTGRLRIRTNARTGNYEVYKVNDPNASTNNALSSDDTLIYSYDASSNTKTMGDSDLFVEYFTGGLLYTTQYTQLELSTKQDTLALSSTSSSISASQLKKLEETTGYESLTNTGTPPPSNTSSTSTASTGTIPNTQLPSSPTTNQPPGSTPAATNATPALGAVASNAGAVYRYPLNVPDLGYDFIKITAYEYINNYSATTPPLAQSLTSAAMPGQSVSQRYTNPLETVILPMQPNISETNSVDWAGDKLNFIQKVAGEVAYGSIKSIGDLDLKALKATGDATMANIKAMFNDPGTKDFIAAYFAGQAVGANVQARATGNVVNPNLELLFSGPRLRTFAFNFKFTPRSDVEALEIKKIIKTFKRNMAPQRSSQGIFLKTPRVFKLEYIYNDTNTQHPYLNKLKPMAMTSFGVNYTPDGSYATYLDGGSVTSYAVDMSFGELEPIYADEIENNWDDMGF